MAERIDDIHDLRVLIWTSGERERFAGPHVYREAKRQGLNVDMIVSGGNADSMIHYVDDLISKKQKPHWIFNYVKLSTRLREYYDLIKMRGINQAWPYHDQMTADRIRMWNDLTDKADVVFFAMLHNAQSFRNHAKHVLWIPQYFDVERCRRDGGLPQRLDPNKPIYDLCFMGGRDGRRREWMIKLGTQFRCWFNKIDLRSNRYDVRGYDMAEIYAQSKMAINIQWRQFVRRDPFITSNRAYNAMGSGCFFLNHYVHQMELLWQEGVHCVTYNDSYEELEAKIRFWLAPENEVKREEIARAGQEDVLTYHTLERRIPQYWRIMQAIQNGETADLQKWSFEQQGKFVTRIW